MRILQVNTSDSRGGSELSSWNLFRAYQHRGHQSYLAVGYKTSTNLDVFEIPNDAKTNLWGRMWLATYKPIRPLRNKIRGTFRLRKILRCIGNPRILLDWQRGIEDFNFPGTQHLLNITPEKPDIVHCHNLHGDYFDLRVLPRLSHQVPVILNLRDAWLLSGHCAHSFDCERWKIGCGSCPYLKTYPAVKRDATAYNWQRKKAIYQQSRLYITAISQWMMDKVKASMLQGVQYRVIPNAIDLTIFQSGDKKEARRLLELPEQAKIVSFIAHNPFKDHVTVESALEQIEIEDGTELLFLCLGKTGKTKQLGRGRVIYTGFEHNQKRMARYYQASDVFVHAAKDEAFGKTVVEAMACGIPVVATAVGGIPEQIEHGRTGFLVPPKDSLAMAATIKQLLADKVLVAKVGAEAVKEAQVRFRLERQVNDFLRWYEEIIEDWKQHIAVKTRKYQK